MTNHLFGREQRRGRSYQQSLGVLRAQRSWPVKYGKKNPEYSLSSCGLWHYSPSCVSYSHLLSSGTLHSPLCSQGQSTAMCGTVAVSSVLGVPFFALSQVNSESPCSIFRNIFLSQVWIMSLVRGCLSFSKIAPYLPLVTDALAVSAPSAQHRSLD